MWKTLSGESRIHFGEHHGQRKSYGSKTILQEVGGHYGIELLDKCL